MMAGVTTPAVRYPFEPLHRIVARRMGLPYCPGFVVVDGEQRPCGGCAQKVHASPAAAARYLGVSKSAPGRWAEEGGIPEPTADMIVLRLNPPVHPIDIDGWGERWLRSIAECAERGDCEPMDRDDPWLLQTELFPGLTG